MSVERKDKVRNQAKVMKAVAKEPTLTERQLAKKAGVSKSTVHNHLEKIGQKCPKSDIMDRILAMDDEIMDLANGITLAKIKKEAPKNEDGSIDVDRLSLNDIKTIWDLANNSTKRKAIFWKKEDDDKEIQFIIS